MTILVTGATGRLGKLITARLVAEKQRVRVFTRRPDVAKSLFGDAVDIAVGAFADAQALRAALIGAEKLLLLSPISETLAEEQIAVADAALAAGVRRIVKISGSDWTFDPPGSSIAGDAHAAVEWHLRALGLEHVALRPNAWMQVSLLNTIRQAEAGQPLTSANPDAGIGFIDARDIADVAVQQVLATHITERPLILTGPEVLSLRDVAARLGAALRRPVTIADGRSNVAPLLGGRFEHRAVAQFIGLIAAGRAAYTTTAVQDLLGRPARSADAFIAEHFATDAALAG